MILCESWDSLEARPKIEISRRLSASFAIGTNAMSDLDYYTCQFDILFRAEQSRDFLSAEIARLGRLINAPNAPDEVKRQLRASLERNIATQKGLSALAADTLGIILEVFVA